MIDAGGEPALPPLDDLEGADELAAALLVVGPSEQTGMGELPLSWQAIEAWTRLTMPPLSPGDLETLREMSAEFVAASNECREKSVPAPFGEPEEAPKASVLMIRSAFRAMQKPGKPPAKGQTA